ncbi:hypothetical protein [Psychrobacillus vulpis]|uniref:Uncharacterized protein n=1 Tax=Psychrobacillus vulpis TaxID=2325572 RepID=A0A544TTI9_9BACI|nr:hypothetical protein [Psychrobacillus vulpis]TQR20745.1 hypothetical protein FG384_06540 [Psychrobacillus vulpis]
MLKDYGKIGGGTIILSLFLLILGVKYVLGHDLVIRNFIAFAVISVLVGTISGALLFYKLKIAYILFTTGLVIGFIELFRSFIVGKDGWGDLVGILSLFIFTAFGLVIGLIVEGILFFIKKNK